MLAATLQSLPNPEPHGQAVPNLPSRQPGENDGQPEPIDANTPETTAPCSTPLDTKERSPHPTPFSRETLLHEVRQESTRPWPPVLPTAVSWPLCKKEFDVSQGFVAEMRDTNRGSVPRFQSHARHSPIVPHDAKSLYR